LKKCWSFYFELSYIIKHISTEKKLIFLLWALVLLSQNCKFHYGLWRIWRKADGRLLDFVFRKKNPFSSWLGATHYLLHSYVHIWKFSEISNIFMFQPISELFVVLYCECVCSHIFNIFLTTFDEQSSSSCTYKITDNHDIKKLSNFALKLY
jgi:hypothetical protein